MISCLPLNEARDSWFALHSVDCSDSTMKALPISLSILLLGSSISSGEDPSFPKRNLQLWLKADAGVTTENNHGKGGSPRDVTRWSDQSGHGIELKPAYQKASTRPELITKVPELRGKPAVRFGGKGGSNFEITDALLGRIEKPFDLNRGTVFLVARMAPISTISPLTLSATANSRTGRGGVGIRRGGAADSWFCVHYGGPGNGKKIQSTEAKLAPGFHILAVTFDKHKTELEMTADGRPSGATLRDKANLPLEPIRFVQIGGHGILDSPGDPGAEWFFNGEIAEVLVFDRILEKNGVAAPFNAVGIYLQKKYGLSGAFK